MVLIRYLPSNPNHKYQFNNHALQIVSRRKNEKYLGFGASSGSSEGRRAAAQAGQQEGSMTSEQEDQKEKDRLESK